MGPSASELASTIVQLAHAGIARSTSASYKRTWDQFNTFAESLNLSAVDVELPLSQNIVAMFTAYLYHNNFAPSTIRSYLSAIAYSHHIQNFENPTDSFLVSKMIKGISLSRQVCDTRCPITLPILHSLLDILCHVSQSVYERHLYSAMFATAFYAFLRCGEVCASQHNIQLSQVTFPADKSHFVIHFVHFKHSKPGQPFNIKISKKSDKYCPVQLLESYFNVRSLQPGPLFCYKDKSPVTRHQFSKQLRTCLAVLRMPAANYKLHSFRIGAATWALLQGKSEAEIQVLDRWSSSTALKKYLRISEPNSI